MPTQNRPRNDRDVIADLIRRVRRLEGLDTYSVGAFVLEVRDRDGALVVRNADTGTETVIAPDA